MNTLLKNTQNEFSKLMSRKKYIVLLALSACVCFLRYGGSVLIDKLSGGSVKIRSNIMLELLPFVAEIIVPLVIFMSVTDLFLGEMQEDSLKAVLMRPITRLKVMTSKIFASYFMAIVYFAVMFIVCCIVQLMTGGRMAAVILPSALAYIIDLVPVFGVVLMGVLINMIAASPSLAMLLCIGIYALMKYLNFFAAPLGQIIFTAYLGWHKLWIGTVLPIHALCANILVIFSTMLIFYTISYILFDRKDF